MIRKSGPEEDVELGGVQPLDRLVIGGEVEHDEEVLRVLVHLRPLALREDVLEVERVPAEALGELRGLVRVGDVQVAQVRPACVSCEPRLSGADGLASRVSAAA